MSLLHPRNRHQGRYDFVRLKEAHEELSRFLAINKYGDETIDFANPEAVKALNRALLSDYYGIKTWDIPKGFLCPAIPGRADYIHNIADLLAEGNQGEIPRGDQVRGLDIGVGANCIYPIIGHCEYGWSFVGADINPLSLDSSRKIVEGNPQLQGFIELRKQPTEKHIFQNLIQTTDLFHFSTCNPPFHASIEEAQMGSRRKWKNLGKNVGAKHEKQLVNFGGQGAELWCEGGELRFIVQMIQESKSFADQVLWFTSLVSKEQTLPKIQSALKQVGAKSWKTLEMAQGQKKSRVIAWTFKA